MYRRSFLKRLLFGSGFTLSGGTAFALQSKKMEITHKRLSMAGIKQNLRIAAVSDLHAPSLYVSQSDFLNRINQLEADVFVLAGDIIGKRKSEHLVMAFRNIKSRHANVAVLGNWEYELQLDLAKLRSHCQEAGIKLLVNQFLQVQGLTIVGLDDFLCGSPDYNLISDLNKNSKSNIVVSHCPEPFDFLASHHQAPLTLISGHTHGGQIAPFGQALITPSGSGDYIHGWYHKKNMSMYVMRGIGTCIIPLRIGAPSEILVLDIESKT